MAVPFLPKPHAFRFGCTGVNLAALSALGRGGATSYKGASPTLRVVFLCMCSNMLWSECLTACWRWGSSSGSERAVSRGDTHERNINRVTVREEEEVEAVEFPDELMGEISAHFI